MRHTLIGEVSNAVLRTQFMQTKYARHNVPWFCLVVVKCPQYKDVY